MAKLYAQAAQGHKAENWSETIQALEELLQKSAEYKDAAQLLRNAKKQKRLKELYAEAKALHAAQKWQAVLKVFEQIFLIEHSYPDPDQFVERIVSTDILAQAEQFAGAGKQGGGVEAARGTERVLLLLQTLWQFVDQLCVDREALRRRDGVRPSRQRCERSLAAHAATRCRVEVSLQPRHVDLDTGGEFDAQCVGGDLAHAAVHDLPDLRVRLQDAFGEQEPRSQFVIVAWRAHRDRHRLQAELAVHDSAEADLQWFLDGDGVVRCSSRVTGFESLYRHPAFLG